jgi:vitamin B12 transporter
MKYLKYFLVSAAFVAVPALAQQAGGDVMPADSDRDDVITVVATGTRVALSDTGQSVGVIGRQEIASIQGPDVTRVLERSAGVSLTRNGGVGGFTSVRVRGAEGDQLLVLIDGVRVADVAAPGSRLPKS